MRTVFNLPNFLFVILLAAIVLQGKRPVESPVVFLVVVIGLFVFYIYQLHRYGCAKYITDIASILLFLLLAWELTTKTFNIADKVLVPPPENVFNVFIVEYKLMLQGLVSSMWLLFTGFSIAMVSGIVLGLFVGWNERLRNSIFPIAKIISPIPPIIYTPYIIALAPTFVIASILVIFLSIFWPTFMNMINAVCSVDRRILDSAKSLNVNTRTMMLKVIFPYTLPGIIKGLGVSVSTSFMTLTLAEMLGAQSGLGYFVKKFSDYGDFTKVIAGIIQIALVITVINVFLKRLEEKVIKWQ